MNNSYHLNNYQVPNIQTLCTSISQLAQEKLPQPSGEVAGQVTKFINAFSLYGKCHNICDQNFIDVTQAHALDLVGKQRSVYM